MAHIGIDARLVHYRVGGTSRYIREIVSAFEELQPAHRITILQSRKSSTRLSKRFSSAKTWTPPHHAWERQALSLELWRHRFDLLHSPDFIAPIRGARRHIITVHDLSFIHYPEYLTADSRRYYDGQIRESVKRADHILSVSQATKQDLIDILDVPAEKISVRLHGVDESFKPLPRRLTAPIIRELGLPSEFVLFVGTLEPRKNLVGLARAYRDLKLELPDAPKLVLVGRAGWHYEKLMADLASVGLADDMIVKQGVSDAQLPALYNHALALVTPSFYEGFGLPALEAMACGAPVITSNLSSLPEVGGSAALLVDPQDTDAISDAILKLETDDARRSQLIEAGYWQAKKFTWERAGRQLKSIYADMLGA